MRLFVTVYTGAAQAHSQTALKCANGLISIYGQIGTLFLSGLSPGASPNMWGSGGHRHLLKPTVKTLRNERGYLFFIDRHTLVALKKKFSSEISGEISRNSSSCFSPTQGSLINLKIRNPSVLTKMARSSLSLSRI